MTFNEFEKAMKKDNLDSAKLQEYVVEALMKRSLKIATAESCTGGLISEKITQVSGASKVFDCGVCSYANEIKTKLLHVKRETLIKYGAVSKQTAEQMARGVRILAGADVGISTTGIAGPTGGTDKKPVGLVYVGVSTQNLTFAIECRFCDDGTMRDREEIRELSAKTALYYALWAVNRI